MAKSITKELPEDKLQLYRQLVEATPGVEIKANFGFPYTALNGNMYSFIAKDGKVGIRLAKEEREAFLEEYKTELFLHSSGTVLKEYVTVPDDLLEDTKKLKKYLAQSHAYALTLKPKPSKKKKK